MENLKIVIDSIAAALCIIVVVLIIAVSLSFGCYQREETKREAIKAGYEESTIPGSYDIGWRKNN